MSLKHHFELLSTYNQWMNSRIYESASLLSVEELAKDRHAFFSSIIGTLNHIVVGDTLWLKRLADHPSCNSTLKAVVDLPDPTSLRQIMFNDIDELYEHRGWLDQTIIDWIAELSESDLDFILSYKNTKGVVASRRYSNLILHFFNHQTHHRGQLSALLSQAGMDIGVTDLLALIPEEKPGLNS